MLFDSHIFVWKKSMPFSLARLLACLDKSGSSSGTTENSFPSLPLQGCMPQQRLHHMRACLQEHVCSPWSPVRCQISPAPMETLKHNLLGPHAPNCPLHVAERAHVRLGESMPVIKNSTDGSPHPVSRPGSSTADSRLEATLLQPRHKNGSHPCQNL